MTKIERQWLEVVQETDNESHQVGLPGLDLITVLGLTDLTVDELISIYFKQVDDIEIRRLDALWTLS